VGRRNEYRPKGGDVKADMVLFAGNTVWYLIALEVFARRHAIQIHVYFTLCVLLNYIQSVSVCFLPWWINVFIIPSSSICCQCSDAVCGYNVNVAVTAVFRTSSASWRFVTRRRQRMRCRGDLMFRRLSTRKLSNDISHSLTRSAAEAIVIWHSMFTIKHTGVISVR